MKALSIRQPWAWLIVHGGKDVENRTWATKLRGQILIHAAKGMTRKEYEIANDLAWKINPRIVLPAFEDLKRGGIVGSVEIVECITESVSPWFDDEDGFLFGFVLRDPQPLPFIPLKGMLGFFEVEHQCACRVTNLDGLCVDCGRTVE